MRCTYVCMYVYVYTCMHVCKILPSMVKESPSRNPPDFNSERDSLGNLTTAWVPYGQEERFYSPVYVCMYMLPMPVKIQRSHIQESDAMHLCVYVCVYVCVYM